MGEHKLPKLGKTGEFPEGKIDPHDEGGISIAITHMPPSFVHDKGKVIMEFGTPVKWAGFDKKGALALAGLIVYHAKQLPD